MTLFICQTTYDKICDHVQTGLVCLFYILTLVGVYQFMALLIPNFGINILPALFTYKSFDDAGQGEQLTVILWIMVSYAFYIYIIGTRINDYVSSHPLIKIKKDC